MKSKLTLISVMVSVLALLFVVAWHEWQSHIITVYFPDGSTKILGEQSITNSQWHVYASPPSPPVSVSRSLKVFWFKASEVLHHTHYSLPQPIPNPARLVDFAGNIRPCAEMSHKTILVADELYSISGTNWMAFEFGPHKPVYADKDWVQSNFDFIRKNGVVAVAPDGRILSKTPCAIIVSGQNVTIVPAYQISKI